MDIFGRIKRKLDPNRKKKIEESNRKWENNESFDHADYTNTDKVSSGSNWGSFFDEKNRNSKGWKMK